MLILFRKKHIIKSGTLLYACPGRGDNWETYIVRAGEDIDLNDSNPRVWKVHPLQRHPGWRATYWKVPRSRLFPNKERGPW